MEPQPCDPDAGILCRISPSDAIHCETALSLRRRTKPTAVLLITHAEPGTSPCCDWRTDQQDS